MGLKMDEGVCFRVAVASDIAALHALIETSVRTLQAQDYRQRRLTGRSVLILGLIRS